MSASRENKLSLFKYWDDDVYMFHHVFDRIESIQNIMNEALKLKEKLEIKIEESKREKEEDDKYNHLIYFIEKINEKLKILYASNFRYRNEESIYKEIGNI